MEPVLIVIGIVILAVVIRLIAGSFDGERVERYLRDQGFELVDRSWAPFGPGWFGEKDSRIYEIIYKDRDGRVHRAHVKTSMMSGVYLTHDRIVEDVTKLSVDEEKAALRKRLAELEGEPGRDSSAERRIDDDRVP